MVQCEICFLSTVYLYGTVDMIKKIPINFVKPDIFLNRGKSIVIIVFGTRGQVRAISKAIPQTARNHSDMVFHPIRSYIPQAGMDVHFSYKPKTNYGALRASVPLPRSLLSPLAHQKYLSRARTPSHEKQLACTAPEHWYLILADLEWPR